MFIKSGTHYEEGSTTTGTHWWLYKGTSIDRYELGAVYAFDDGPGASFAKPPTIETHGPHRMLIKQEFGVNGGVVPFPRITRFNTLSYDELHQRDPRG